MFAVESRGSKAIAVHNISDHFSGRDHASKQQLLIGWLPSPVANWCLDVELVPNQEIEKKNPQSL